MVGVAKQSMVVAWTILSVIGCTFIIEQFEQRKMEKKCLFKNCMKDFTQNKTVLPL